MLPMSENASALPTYISLSDATRRYEVDRRVLTNLIESG
jgi:hypothetical protein